MLEMNDAGVKNRRIEREEELCVVCVKVVVQGSTLKLLQVPYLSTDLGRRAFSYSSPGTWNSIYTSIRNCSSLYSLTHHLKSRLIAQLINTVLRPRPPGDCPRLRFLLNA